MHRPFKSRAFLRDRTLLLDGRIVDAAGSLHPWNQLAKRIDHLDPARGLLRIRLKHQIAAIHAPQFNLASKRITTCLQAMELLLEKFKALETAFRKTVDYGYRLQLRLIARRRSHMGRDFNLFS